MSCIRLVLLLFLSSILIVGCAGIDTIVHIPPSKQIKKKPYKHGPPPHAPAHGYRHKHRHGVALEYDTGIGAYVVINLPGTYFYNGLYTRYSSKGHWIVAEHFDGPWHIAAKNEVPPKLKKSKGKGKGRPGKGKGSGKKKKHKIRIIGGRR